MSSSQKPNTPPTPPLRHCTNPSCYGCPLWIWQPPRNGHPGSTVCGFCGDTGRAAAPCARRRPVTLKQASAMKRRSKLQFAGAETAAEVAAAGRALRGIGDVLAASIEAGRRSLERSCEMLHLLDFAVWENPGPVCPCGLAKGSQCDPRRRGVNERVYNTTWHRVTAEIAAKKYEVEGMCEILKDIRKHQDKIRLGQSCY